MKWIPYTGEMASHAELPVLGLCEVVFVVRKQPRCWDAWFHLSLPDEDPLHVGDYRTERLAKAACRRKAGRIVDALKRGIRA